MAITLASSIHPSTYTAHFPCTTITFTTHTPTISSHLLYAHPTLQLQSLLGRSTHVAKRALLHHQSHNLVQRVRSRHGGQLSIGVVGRCNLDDICADEVDALEATNNSAELTRRPATSLWCTGRRRNYLVLVTPSKSLRRIYRKEDLQAGSRVSISILRYTGFSRPTRSLIFLTIPSMPILSISRASTIWKPQ